MPDITLPNHHEMDLPELVDDFHKAVCVIASFSPFSRTDRREWEARGRAAADEATRRGWIFDPEVAFNAAYFELGARQAREEIARRGH